MKTLFITILLMTSIVLAQRGQNNRPGQDESRQPVTRTQRRGGRNSATRTEIPDRQSRGQGRGESRNQDDSYRTDERNTGGRAQRKQYPRQNNQNNGRSREQERYQTTDHVRPQLQNNHGGRNADRDTRQINYPRRGICIYFY